MNFVIVGAGAIGCYLGGRLAFAGQHVTLVGRPRVIDALAAHGLTVTDLDGFNAHIDAAALRLATSLQGVATGGSAVGNAVGSAVSSAVSSAGGNAVGSAGGDAVILLCVKGGGTEAAAREIAQVCKPGTTVISMQNGVNNVARIQTHAPQMQALAGMVPYNVVMTHGQDGHRVHRATTGSLYIGWNGDHGEAGAATRKAVTGPIAAAFNAAGLPTEVSADMRAVQWGKLLLNLNNPVNALSGLPLKAQLQDRDYRRVLADLQSEALAVLKNAGIAPAKVAAVAPRALPHLLRLPNWLFTRVAARMLRMDAEARSSMWDDLQQGRTTEIDDLCGAVVRLARAHGGSAPLNARMCELVAQHTQRQHTHEQHTNEQHFRGQRLSGAQMRKALSVN